MNEEDEEDGGCRGEEKNTDTLRVCKKQIQKQYKLKLTDNTEMGEDMKKVE